MTKNSPLVILDRDGVLNRMVIDADHGFIDSPLNPDQVVLHEGAAEALALLTDAGIPVSIASNQPAAAKGKTTRALLDATHDKVVSLAEAAGGKVASSHICFHQSGDGCACRKPQTGLLEGALADQALSPSKKIWMVGDGVTDVQAGQALGLSTAFLGPQKCDACKIMSDAGSPPAFWAASLLEFVNFLLGRGRI